MFARLYGLEAISLRYSNVYGTRQNSRSDGGVVAIFAQRVLAGESLVLYGDGEQTRDMVFVADVAAANIAATECSRCDVSDIDACAYNIGTGIETSITKLARHVLDILRQDVGIEHAAPRHGDVRRSALASEKATRMLGWQPQTSLLDGLRYTFRTLQ